MSEGDEIRQHDEQYVNGIAADLMRHFDSVQIFVTRQEPCKNTLAFSIGSGNWYARFGQVQEWLNNGGAMHLTKSEDDDDGD
jgi:hypothetical protein